MSEKFTASNGVEISITPEGIDTYLLGKGGVIPGGERRWTVATGNKDGMQALREFFLHERDQELGRWRDPEDPTCVVYPATLLGEVGKPSARVLSETTGFSALCGREDTKLPQSAANYFAAHPLPKPWHDAQHEEAWLLTVNGDEGVFLAEHNHVHGSVLLRAANGTTVKVTDDEQITAGRRIWPEAVES